VQKDAAAVNVAPKCMLYNFLAFLFFFRHVFGHLISRHTPTHTHALTHTRTHKYSYIPELIVILLRLHL